MKSQGIAARYAENGVKKATGMALLAANAKKKRRLPQRFFKF
jgi:hypothetical protein